jgi:hypothetical protein
LQPRGETLARNAHPWLANEEDPKTIAFRELEGTPLGQQAKRLAPFWQYWLGCAVATHVAIVNAVKKNGANGRPALAPDVRAMAGRAPVLPGGAGGGAQPPPKPGPRSALADYHKALKEGVLPATALERFYQATGLGV